MKIDNIKTGLKRASAVALATVSMCPSMNATKHREYEEKSSSVVSNVISFGAGALVVGAVWAGFHFFGNKETKKDSTISDNKDKNKVAIPEEVEKLYTDYRKKTEDADEIALIDATYEYWKYSVANMFVKLEKVAENITDEEFNKVFEKTAEYKYFGKLKLVNQDELKDQFKKNRGNKDYMDCCVWQLGFADDMLINVVKTHTKEANTAIEFVDKLVNNHMIRNNMSDWFERWGKAVK